MVMRQCAICDAPFNSLNGEKTCGETCRRAYASQKHAEHNRSYYAKIAARAGRATNKTAIKYKTELCACHSVIREGAGRCWRCKLRIS